MCPMANQTVFQEGRMYLLYRAVLLGMGSLFSAVSFFSLIWLTLKYDPSESLFALALMGGACAVAIWLVSRGFSRQRLSITSQGFIPFWKGLLDSRQRGQTLIPWSNVLFVAQVGKADESDDSAIWVDLIAIRRGKKTVVYVVNPSSMVSYDNSTMMGVRDESGGAFEMYSFETSSSFERFLLEQGIRPEFVDYKSGEFEAPIITT